MGDNRTSIAVLPDRRDRMKSWGRKGDNYNDIIDAIEAIIKKYNITIPITPL